MLRRYETMIIFDPSLSDEDLVKQIEKIEGMITSSEGGEIINVDRWGKKRLAYEIKGKQFGLYVVFEYKADSALPKELDRACRLENNVVRHMILEIPDKVIKMKARELELKANLDRRRKDAAEAADDNQVVDMLKAAGEIVEEEKPAEKKPAEKKAEEKKAEDKAEKAAE